MGYDLPPEREPTQRCTVGRNSSSAPATQYEAIPEATREGATGEALLAIAELDLDELATIQPPRGFGRD